MLANVSKNYTLIYEHLLLITLGDTKSAGFDQNLTKEVNSSSRLSEKNGKQISFLGIENITL
jgi:hypothetical protein